MKYENHLQGVGLQSTCLRSCFAAQLIVNFCFLYFLHKHGEAGGVEIRRKKEKSKKESGVLELGVKWICLAKDSTFAAQVNSRVISA
jgi:hypothetical protein